MLGMKAQAGSINFPRPIPPLADATLLTVVATPDTCVFLPALPLVGSIGVLSTT